MARRRKGRAVNAILLLDKPKGLSSNAALQRVKRLFDAQKAGHCGSLDPMATGLLPICFGHATRVSGLFLNAHKSYSAQVKLGIATDSGDADGAINAESPVPDNWIEQLPAVCERFLGAQMQIPPMVSALHHEGRRLYDLARAGIEVPREPRKIEIASLRLDSTDFATATFRITVSCSKGTYIRVLAEDIARALGTCGHLTELRRTALGGIDSMLPMWPLLEPEQTHDQLDQYLLPIDTVLQHLPKVRVTAQACTRIRHGNRINAQIPDTATTAELIRLYDPEETLLALAQPCSGTILQPRVMLVDAPNVN